MCNRHPIALRPAPVTVSSVAFSNSPDFTAGLNAAQAEAVSYAEGPMLVLAGPGSGKTRVLTHRIARLVTSGVPAHRILAVTFTNKAAHEMRLRLGGDRDEKTGLAPDAVEFSRLDGRSPRPGLLPSGLLVPSSISTFHSCCLRTLRLNAVAAGLPRGFSVFDVADSLRVIQANESGLEKREVQALFEAISALRNLGVLSAQELLEPEASPVIDGLRFDLGDVEFFASQWERYQVRMLELGALDFDDLLVKTLQLLRSPVGAHIGAYYDAFLVDEFQDTNIVQFEILHRLALDRGTIRDVCVVGDPEQAIFGWRGGSAEMMDRFVEVFDPVKVVELGENYRSTGSIVETSQRILDASSAKFKIKLSTNNPLGAKPRVYVCEDSEDEAERAAAAVKAHVDRGESSAVLVRTKAQTRPFEVAFARLRIVHNVVGATRFVDRSEVKDALAYLHVVANPKNDPAFERAVISPRRGLGEGAIEKLRVVSPAASLREKLADTGSLSALSTSVRGKFTAFAELLDDVESAARLSPYEALRVVLDGGLRDSFSDDPDRVANLDELLAAAKSFGAPVSDSAEHLADFLALYSLSASTDDVSPRRAAKAVIITAHAAKGNEFDHVWIAGLDEDVFPHLFASSPDEAEEERRLLYVAASRPRTTLTVSHRARRIAAGRWQDSRPSPFLAFFTGTYRHDPRPEAALRADVVRLTPDEVKPGTVVLHDVFGSGTVLTSAGSVVEICFDAPAKVRKIDLAFAPLRLA